MFSKGEKNYLIDVVLGIVGLLCMATGVLLQFRPAFIMNAVQLPLKELHVWTGYGMLAGVAVHLLMHSKWIKALTKNMVGSRRKALALVMTVVAVFGLCYALAVLGPKGPSRPGGERPTSQWQEQGKQPDGPDTTNGRP